jgi:hypothetical protein
MRNFLRLLCCLFAGILPLSGQSEPEAEKRPPAGRTAWFACLAKPEGLENPVKILAGDQVTELELPPYMASLAVEIPADGILRIVRPVPDPEDPAKTKYLILAEARIPDTVREALVILAPLPKPAGDLLFRSMVQDLAKFKGGDRLYINLSDTDIRVRLDKTTVPVASGRVSIYETSALAEATNIPVMYQFYHSGRKEWKILSASTVVVRPTRREITVFNNGTSPGNIRKHKILFPVSMASP